MQDGIGKIKSKLWQKVNILLRKGCIGCRKDVIENEKDAAFFRSHADFPLPGSGDNSERDDDQFVPICGVI